MTAEMIWELEGSRGWEDGWVGGGGWRGGGGGTSSIGPELSPALKPATEVQIVSRNLMLLTFFERSRALGVLLR
jgi:hypothetical protein